MSDKLITRPIKLFHEAWESKERYENNFFLNGNHFIKRYVFSSCLAHCSSPQSEKWFIFLSNFTMHYSSWDQNFPGLIFASAFSDHEYINERWHFAVADVAHSVISMQICQKFENTTNCTRRSFLASLPRCLYLEFTHSLHSFKFIKKKFNSRN